MDIQNMALFTDIHFGAKGNSTAHNQDCIDYLEWFIKNTKKQKCDAICFLGDWFENRTSINVSTMNYSEKGLDMINSLGIPVYFILGNHDLFLSNSRDIHSVGITRYMENFNLITETTVIKNGDNDFLLVPWLLKDEYTSLKKYTKVKTWLGHFEFSGFDLGTGQLTNGIDTKQFKKPDLIVSGHYHKRITVGNVTYMGNTFPTTFANANDTKYGMAICDFTKELMYMDWEDAPQYQRVMLSEVIEGDVDIIDNARVECLADITITYNESIKLRKKFIKDASLREFKLIETTETQELLEGEDIDIEDEVMNSDTDTFVHVMLNKIESGTLSNERLIKLYGEL
jgi:DNA repair exonuclease SbcCD nuclease subunit